MILCFYLVGNWKGVMKSLLMNICGVAILANKLLYYCRVVDSLLDSWNLPLFSFQTILDL